MEKDIRAIYSEFNESAARIFSSLFNEFRNETERIEKDGDENALVLLKRKYASVLKHRLEEKAGNFVDRCNTTEEQGRLRIAFAEQVNYFQREFMRKSSLI